MSEKVTFTISGHQVIVRKAKKIGNGAYAPIPAEWLGREITIVLTGDEIETINPKQNSPIPKTTA